MVLAVWSYLASLVMLSVLAPVMGQQRWQVANPWSHGPLIKTPAGQQPRPQPNYQQPQPLPRPQPNYQQPQPLPRPQPNYQQPQPNYHQQPQPLPRPQPYYQQPPHPHPGYQPQAAPQHWNNQPAVAYQNPHPSAHSVAPAPAAPAPTSAAATPLEVEPLEVEGPTTPKLTPPPLPAYAYGPSPQAAPRPAWPAPTNQNAQPWGSPRVAPPQPAYHGQPVHQPVAPHAHSGYSGQNYQGHYPVQPAAPQPQYQQVPQAAEAGNPLSRYDVFSSNFDAGAFQRAHYQAYASTTAAPIPLNLNSGGGGGAAAAGGAGNGAWSGREWANSFNSGGFNIGFPTTPPPLPPTTTPDHRVQINPYRHGGFYLGVPNPQERPKPVTEIIQIAQNDPNGPTMNPLNGWLGKTPPPALRPTTALPGKDGNVFAGFLGFHAEEPTTPPASKSINQINAKYQQYFAPVPVESANTQNGGGFQDGNLPRPQPNRPPQQGAVGATGLTDAQLKTEICNSFGMLCH